jgi:hypothetical protein
MKLINQMAERDSINRIINLSLINNYKYVPYC